VTFAFVALGIVIGSALGVALAWLWLRARILQLRAERDAARQTSVAEVTQAAARAAAEQAAAELARIEERAGRDIGGELERQRGVLETTVADLVRPVTEQLAAYKERVEHFQTTSTHLHGELRSQLEQLALASAGLQRETGNLVNALRRPEVRGSWGEQQLRRIIELAGMVEHCDFDEQVQLASLAGERQRPDLVVHLPNAREVIVDAKVPLDAYLDALNAKDEHERALHLRRHAAQLDAHIAALARRSYQEAHKGSVDFVVAYVPRDPMLAAAYEADPDLFDRAIANHVVIATPTTLIALLRAIAYGWQQEAIARNAQEIAAAGKALYDRFRTLSGHLGRLGARIQAATEAYNELVGSLERRVLPAARRFEDLGVVRGSETRLEDPVVVTEVARSLVAPELNGDDEQPSGDVPDGSSSAPRLPC
jgi:DNA recombination protein RmuC